MTDLYELREELRGMSNHPSKEDAEILEDVLEEVKYDNESLTEVVAIALASLTSKKEVKDDLLSLGWDEELVDSLLEDASDSQKALKDACSYVEDEINHLISQSVCPCCGGQIVADGYTDYGNGRNDLGCGWTTTKVYCENCGEKFDD